MDGRYGPYVKHGKINATLPKDMTPETITFEQALELVAAKAAKGGGKKKKAAPKKKKAAPKKKTVAKKKAAPKKKTAAKKKTASE
jgi:DNA topoisomerase-1